MITTHYSECEECGAEIVYLLLDGQLPAKNHYGYTLCDDCVARKDREEDAKSQAYADATEGYPNGGRCF